MFILTLYTCTQEDYDTVVGELETLRGDHLAVLGREVESRTHALKVRYIMYSMLCLVHVL